MPLLKQTSVGCNDPSLKHVKTTNEVVNISMGIDYTENASTEKRPRSTVFGFNALTKANATVARDKAISENHMDGKLRQKTFEEAFKAAHPKPKWDVPVPDDFKTLLGEPELFHRCFNIAYRNRMYAKQDKENRSIEQKTIKRNTAHPRRMYEYEKELRRADARQKEQTKFFRGPFQTAADNKRELQMRAGQHSRSLWKPHPLDKKEMVIHPQLKPSRFLRNITGLWGQKCLDCASKPLPDNVKSKYHAKDSDAVEMFPLALNEVFKLPLVGKEYSAHNLRVRAANDRVDLYGSAPAQKMEYFRGNDTPKKSAKNVQAMRQKGQASLSVLKRSGHLQPQMLTRKLRPQSAVPSRVYQSSSTRMVDNSRMVSKTIRPSTAVIRGQENGLNLLAVATAADRNELSSLPQSRTTPAKQRPQSAFVSQRKNVGNAPAKFLKKKRRPVTAHARNARLHPGRWKI